jgi:hypothetical protein
LLQKGVQVSVIRAGQNLKRASASAACFGHALDPAGQRACVGASCSRASGSWRHAQDKSPSAKPLIKHCTSHMDCEKKNQVSPCKWGVSHNLDCGYACQCCHHVTAQVWEPALAGCRRSSIARCKKCDIPHAAALKHTPRHDQAATVARHRPAAHSKACTG